MRSNVNSPWTEARIADLVRLWSHGYSCAQIGALIGVSRNAVIGKASRLKLPTHSRCNNVNGQKRMVDPIPAETPRSPSRHPRPKSVFKSREIRPKTKIKNPNAKPALMTAISMFTGKYTGAQMLRRPGIGEKTKDELRAMLTTAIQNTAALEAT